MAKSIWRQFPDDYLQGWCCDFDSDGSAGQSFVADAEALATPVVLLEFFEPFVPPPTPGENVTRMLLGFIG